jgi:hypothetical protein
MDWRMAITVKMAKKTLTSYVFLSMVIWNER